MGLVEELGTRILAVRSNACYQRLMCVMAEIATSHETLCHEEKYLCILSLWIASSRLIVSDLMKHVLARVLQGTSRWLPVCLHGVEGLKAT